MSDAKKLNGADKSQAVQDKGQQLVGAATVAIAAQANMLLTMGFTVPDVVNLLCETACDLVAAIEPSQLRQATVSEMVKNLPHIVDRHYQMRHTTPGGLIVPGR